MAVVNVGFVILAHERLDLVARLAAHLAGYAAPVVIHVDVRAGTGNAFAGLPAGVSVISKRAADWGRYGLVAATLDGVEALLDKAPGIGHVALLSGSCLPIRPVPELEAFLERHPRTDFIESVPAAGSDWVQDGLSEERFTLRHPFSWRRHRRLFDLSVAVQRLAGASRTLPEGLVPHLGLQWWCLTAATLRAILDHPRLEAFETFFRHVWIPDEGFFQSIVRMLPKSRVESRPLTLQRFDGTGRPHVFHDDHIRLLEQSDYFFARKIDEDAEGLRHAFLRHRAARPGQTSFWSVTDEAVFDGARERPLAEHRGLQTQGRYPGGATVQMVDTAVPYAVLVSDDRDLLAGLRARLMHGVPRLRLHGHLFGPDPADFRRAGAQFWGNLPAAPLLRDYRPEQFLSRLIWAEREVGTAFLFDPTDSLRIGRMVARDRNARIVLLPRTMRDETLLGMLRRHPAGRRRKGSLYASYRSLPGEELAGELAGPGAGRVLAELCALAGEGWQSADGWTVGDEEPE